MRIATFNLQNLRLRGQHLDGARDLDEPHALPLTPQDAQEQADADRQLTALVIRDCRADLVALQEVFDQASLDHFHQHYLRPLGLRFPHRHCLPGNDGRGFDVAVLSRWPLSAVASHAQTTPAALGLALAGQAPDQPIFRRDVLQVALGELTLFICHFKAPYPDPQAAALTRRGEAQALRRVIEAQFPNPDQALWLVLGDLNEPGSPGPDSAIAPLLHPFSADLMRRQDRDERWSYARPEGHSLSRPDMMLASPALARRWPEAKPEVIRSGLPLSVRRNPGPHLAQVGHRHPHASDHAALVLELPGLHPGSASDAASP